MEGVTAKKGGELIGINTNLGDKVCPTSNSHNSPQVVSQRDTSLTWECAGHLQEQLLPQDSVPGLQRLRQGQGRVRALQGQDLLDVWQHHEHHEMGPERNRVITLSGPLRQTS